MRDKLVSVITPAYCCERFIGKAIQSVQSQTYFDWELIIVDDGSPDGTFDVVQYFSKEDSRIRLFRQANSGPAIARQNAIDQSRGRYIAFLDSDDFWLPQKLERQLAFMSKHCAALSYTAFRRIHADGSSPGRLISIPLQLTYRALLGNTAIATSSAVIDKSITGDLRMTNTYYDDFVLWLSILKRGHVALGLNEDLMRYRVVGGSVSRNKIKSAFMVWRVYRDIEGLSVPLAAISFLRYALHAYSKYKAF